MAISRLESSQARLAVDTIRLLAADAVEEAGSGHPGTPMEAAPAAYLLFTRHLRHNPTNPDWPGRDRFILSCGHASALLYSLLHLCGYDLCLDDLKSFRRLDSRTPGHPEYRHTPGVETTTGPLGQGVATGVGMAMGARFLTQRVDADLFDYRVYVLCSDGDLMEGVAAEAVSLAGHLKLGNLNLVYLDNRITIEGETQLAFTEDVGARFLACGWHVQRVEGENLLEIDAALARARAEERPSLIVARTHIGYGSPGKQDSADAHGAPLGEEELRRTKEALHFDPDRRFVVPERVAKEMGHCASRGIELERQWSERLHRTEREHPDRIGVWRQAVSGQLPDLKQELPQYAAGTQVATRKAGGEVLNRLAGSLPLLLGGSADLGPSNNTTLIGENDFAPGRCGRNIHFGVREHAMGAVLNGLAHTPGLIPFGGTFLIFSDYMRPPMRLAAMMGLGTIYVLTHDSIALGEDGPTHQPVEQIASLRAIPGLCVIRPCDAGETVQAWTVAIARRSGPTALVLSRQPLPVLDRDLHAAAEGLQRGGYILCRESKQLQIMLIASGSEVHPALDARLLLEQQGIGTRVVSLPSWELFEAQEPAYRQQVLPPSCATRLAVEAASPFGWERYVGTEGEVVAIDRFGASGEGGALMGRFGFTPESIAGRARALLGAS